MSGQSDIFDFLKTEGIEPELTEGVKRFRAEYPVPEEFGDRLRSRERSGGFVYYGREIWNKAIAALLCGKNLLLAGPKATGKNVLSENLCELFGRPGWNISFHVSMDASYLIGADTFNGEKVVFRPGPVTECARCGGFAILDEINMAKNEALAVLHASLDFRRVIEIPGYERIPIHGAARFLATMNYGYAGTRELNEALTSRFAVLSMPVISGENLEKLLFSRFPDLSPKYRGQFTALFMDLEKKAESAEISERAVDLRGLIDALGLIRAGLSAGDALDMCVRDKTFDPFERKLIGDLMESRIPRALDRSRIFS